MVRRRGDDGGGEPSVESEIGDKTNEMTQHRRDEAADNAESDGKDRNVHHCVMRRGGDGSFFGMRGG